MTQNTTQRRHPLKYGLIIGGCIAVYQFLIYLFALLNIGFFQEVVFFIMIFGIMISVRHFRDRLNGGLLNFRKAFATGMLTSIYIVLVMGVYTWIRYKYMSPHLITDLILQAEESLAQMNLSDEMLDKQLDLIPRMYTPGFVAIASAAGNAFTGALISLITALLLKRDENPLIANNKNL